MSTDTPFLPPPVLELVSKIAALLIRRKETVAIAESACGGLISAALLSFPGSSAYHKGAWVQMISKVKYHYRYRLNIDDFAPAFV